MANFLREPGWTHGTPSRTAVLLANLGTPDAPTAPAVRRYLKQFLSDPRVVEIPRAIWWFILNGIILNTRPRQSAAKYAAIWTSEGSPLRVHTEKLAKLAKGLLGQRGKKLHVAWAMRYGSPGIPEVLTRLKTEGVDRILVIPLYPQYAASTTATVVDEVAAWLEKTRNQPEIRFVRHFHDDDSYLAALEHSVRSHWQINGLPGPAYKLVMSFHGLPRRSLSLGDPYHCECLKTARLLGERLNLSEQHMTVCFQSRFGRAEWLKPYTSATLKALPGEGIKRVDVICPGFVADCLETLEEIAIEAKSIFLTAGGESFNYIPALNEQPLWVDALCQLIDRHTAGWPECDMPPAELAASAARARALGADK